MVATINFLEIHSTPQAGSVKNPRAPASGLRVPTGGTCGRAQSRIVALAANDLRARASDGIRCAAF